MVSFKFSWTFLQLSFSIFNKLCSASRDLLLQIYSNLFFIFPMKLFTRNFLCFKKCRNFQTKNKLKELILAKIFASFTSPSIYTLQKILSWVLPLLDVRNCCKLSLYAISRKTNEPNLRKWQKNLVLAPSLQIWTQHFFFFADFTCTTGCFKKKAAPC